MIKIIKANSWFFGGFLIYLIGGLIILLTHPKGSFEIWLNQYHNSVADVFFTYYTWIGDGVFYAIVILFLFWRKNWQTALLGIICFITTGLAAQFVKRFIFADAPRPKAFFGENLTLHFVEGLEIHTSQSFPSGHTTTAFSVFCLLSLLFASKKWGLVCLILAIFAGLSRVYLLQHFFADTYFGAMLGTFLTLIIFLIYIQNPKFKNKIIIN